MDTALFPYLGFLVYLYAYIQITFNTQTMKTLGIILLIVGIAMTLFTAVNYTTHEKIIDIGNMEMTHHEPQHLDWSPYAGVLLLGIGGLIIWKSQK